MNAKTLSVAMSLILSLTALSANAASARVDHIVDLPAVTVQPDAALRAELAAANTARVDHIVDLPAVTVRPDAVLRAELANQAFVAYIVDLPAINVRPSAEQLAERAAIRSRRTGSRPDRAAGHQPAGRDAAATLP
ncbi:hypothetical protein H1235_16995 [Pseudoxanthomonas sp. NC8]|nr:hypothetical protein H1235_16995 [Pseudoxanthomonas sp. NC8]